MSKKVLFPLIAVVGLSIVGSLGCQASANMKAGTTEPKAATPPPPEPPPPPPPPAEPPAPPPKPIKAIGKAKVEGNIIKFKEKIHFETDKSTLKNDAETQGIIKDVCGLMKENTQITTMRVDGHTDNVGGGPHNQTLSQGRADAVVAALVKCGTEASRLEAHGYGEDRNIVPNDTAANKEQNRRVEFRVWAMDGKPTDAQKHDDPPAGSAAAAGGGGATPAAGGTTVGSSAPKPGATPAKPGTPASTPATPTPAH